MEKNDVHLFPKFTVYTYGKDYAGKSKTACISIQLSFLLVFAFVFIFFWSIYLLIYLSIQRYYIGSPM